MSDGDAEKNWECSRNGCRNMIRAETAPESWLHPMDGRIVVCPPCQREEGLR